MRTVGTASHRVQLPYKERAAIEKSAQEGFGEGREWGGGECRQILRDWFPRLLERVAERNGAEADISDYKREIDDAFPVLEGMRSAFCFNELPPSGSTRYRLWAWPTEQALHSRPKEWSKGVTSPADADRLADALADYIERPWLQHNAIDGAAINALMFSTLASTMELHETGELIGRPNWSYILSERNVFKMLGIGVALRVCPLLMRWMMLPAVAMGLSAFGHEMAAGFVLILWLGYLLYRLVTFPARRQTLRTLQKKKEAAAQTIVTMMKAWQYSNGPVINPSRLKELALAAESEYDAIIKPQLALGLAERQGAVFRPVLHT
jgi:hypothetical protein